MKGVPFLSKNSVYKSKGLDLEADPPRVKLCWVSTPGENSVPIYCNGKIVICLPTMHLGVLMDSFKRGRA